MIHAEVDADADSPALSVKANYVGAPKVFALELACRQLAEAFGGFGCYLVGSCLSRPNWRDVDVVLILKDEEFGKLFPAAGNYWEWDPRWLIMTVSISEWLSRVTDLPVDFKFQPQTLANERHNGPRYAIGIRVTAPSNTLAVPR